MKGLKKLLVMILTLSAVASTVLISASATTGIASGAGIVSCDILNVRAKADTTSTVLSTIQQGDYVVILDKPGSDWYHVSAYGTVGYVASKYITGVETAKNFSATGKLHGSDIRMRSGPSTSGDILGTYQAGTTMNVIGINNGWYKVKYDGKTGYIRSDFMDLSGGGATLSEGQKIAIYAKQFVGYPYVYGAESPSDGFDCSGLTYYVYGHFGYSLERRASMQYAGNGTSVSKANLKPGDLVFFSSDGEGVTHVGLYYGDGMFVNASTESTGVIFSSLSSDWYTRTYWGAKRILS